MPLTISPSATLIEAVQAALEEAAAFNDQTEVAPAAILWPDERKEWEALLPALRAELPHLLTLGAYEPGKKSGPAIWIKCMIARTLDAADWPEDTIPIVYMPGVSHRDIRAVDQCPEELKPLAELKYRGTLWTQVNHKDWTVRAFLVSDDGGLGLTVGRDEATRKALQLALPDLAHEPLETLGDRAIRADTVRNITISEPVRDLLHWIGTPDETRAAWPANRWELFCDECRDTYSVDPEQDGPLSAARKLGLKEGPWARVWQRFIEAPARYPGLEEKLRQARPPKAPDLFAREPAWPQENEEAENELRAALNGLPKLGWNEARERVHTLEDTHGERRDWVWADLEKAPLARALEHVATLARAVATPVGGQTPDAVAATYRDGGWEADAAALKALQAVRKPEDVSAVRGAVDVLYRPWLERSAEALQEAVATQGMPGVPAPPEVNNGEVVLFADALRYDIGEELVIACDETGYDVERDWQWSAVPSLTATAKPAVAPIATAIDEKSPSDEFAPDLKGKRLNASRFNQWMKEKGYQVLDQDETGDPEGKAWTAIGTLDSHGHDEGWKIARRIDEVLRDLVGRVRQLLEAGWAVVHVVTDHGWLVLPEDLPKEELPHYLAETRWGRCATLKEQSKIERLVVAWHWNPEVRIAMASGINVHRKGLQYAHGGISVQECVVPRLRITAPAGAGQLPAIEEVTWQRLRCRIQITNVTDGLSVDLRTRPQDANTSVASVAKAPKDDGTVSLLVPNAQLEGEEVSVVLLRQGNALSIYTTTVGAHA
jgi:hypothetical protein